MDYNPFAAELQDLDEEIEDLQCQRAGHVAQIDWAARFDLAEEADEVERLRSDLDQKRSELTDLATDLADSKETLQRLGSQTATLESEARLGSKASRLFASDHKSTKERLAALRSLPSAHKRAKSELAEHKGELRRLRKHIDDATDARDHLSGDVTDLKEALDEREAAIERFNAFDSHNANGAISRIDEDLAALRADRAPVATRAKEVDIAVAEPLAERIRIEAEISKHRSELSSSKHEQSRLKTQISTAEDIDDRLSSEPDSYERKKLHDECEREFGDGSPRKVINSIRSKLRQVEQSIGYHDRQVDRLDRATIKTERRIEELADIAARQIEALVIDGNNCCYDSDGFIGLAALIPMTEHLANTYTTTVIFDASIRRLLNTSDQGLQVMLPNASIHVVASGTRADETILDAASSATTWVISNDRYSEFPEKGPVSDGRIIRHEILKDRVLVHGLGVNETLVDPDGASDDWQA